MERKEILNLLEKQYPKETADIEDFVGLQVDGSLKINKIMVTLDTTLDVIHQAIESNVNMIISHHPMIFGDKEELFKKNKMLKAKYDLLNKLQINLFIIHTNADWNNESISWTQAIKLNLKNIKFLPKNLGIKANFSTKKTISEVSSLIKNKNLLNYDFRTNVDENKTFSNVVIGSGASGSLIFMNEVFDSLLIVGEMKHHEWVFANEHNLRVLEIGHFSEIIFKDMISNFLSKKIKTIESKEKNGYKAI